MASPDHFREIKLLFGTMDDLCQQRRKAYTDWAASRMDPAEFVTQMRENLRRTNETASALEKLLVQEN